MNVIVVEGTRRVIVGVAERGATGPPGSGGGGGGGNATSMSQLSDVQFSGLSSGDLVAYSSTNSKWINVKQSTVTDGGNF